MKNFFVSVFFLVSAMTISAGVIEKSYFFQSPSIKTAGEFQTIGFDNTMITGITGEPALPYHAVQLLLPTGEKAISIEFIGENEVQLPGTYRIIPGQASKPLSQPGEPSFAYNHSVYQTNASYPAKQTGELTTQYLNGYAIALCTFTPVKYNPATGVVTIFQKVNIRIKTESNIESVNALKNLKQGEGIDKKIHSFAQNAELMDQYPAGTKDGDDYQLLIITPAQFEANFAGLVEIYLERGIKTEIVTKETISTSGSGQDLQEKIRNFIIQEYQDNSIEYVLLGGDVEHIPYRGFYSYVVSGGGYEDDNIPADLYYAGLDGNWNTDSDNRWGEPGEDDLLPDLAVGRFTFSNETGLLNMLHKTISYQNNPVLGEFNNALMAGEWLYGSPYETWGSDYLETLIGHNTENGYETWGIPESYNYQKLYEEIQPWYANDLITAINSGKQFVHHVGHANSTYVAYMSNSDITNANFAGANGVDHNYTIFQSHGCICGAFDENDCIMEKMVTIENFAVAVIGNSRYGWFNEGQTEGPAAHLHREMVDAMYHENIQFIGAAFSEAKIQTAPWVTAPGQWEEGALRWNFYDINILGDPTLSVWTAEPIMIQTVYENELLISSGSTSVTVTSGGEPMENFSCSVMMNGVLYGTAMTDATGVAVINFETAFAAAGEGELIISGMNCLPTAYPVTIHTGTTGMGERHEDAFALYPNPSNGVVSIGFNGNDGEAEIWVTNVMNEVVLIEKTTASAGKSLNIDLGQLSKGFYLVKVKTESYEVTRKVIVN